MSYALEISDAAQSDIREIFRYIALELRSGINASGQIQRIEDEIYSLSEMPERYPRYGKEPWFSRGLRLVTVDHYNIYYLVDKEHNSVSVMRVLYGRRDMESALNETE